MSAPQDAQETSKTGLRTLLQWIDTGLPFVGVLVIMAAILFVHDVSGQIVVAALGILMIEAGVWRLAHQLLPNQRRYHALRAELNGFYTLAGQLNEVALDVKKTRCARNSASVRAHLRGHAAVDRTNGRRSWQNGCRAAFRGRRARVG